MPSNLYWFLLTLFLHEKSYQQPYSNALECECGKFEDFVPRIVGGREVEQDRHPWMAAIVTMDSDFCGGTLINDRYVLTAAHCLNYIKKKTVKVFLGIHSLKQMDITLPAEVDSIIPHENFKVVQSNDKKDIGLIRLKNPVKFSPSIKPICLPKKGSNYTRVKAKVLGWGLLSENADRAEELMGTELKTLTHIECLSHPIIGNKIGGSSLCAYGENTDACQGDSGGPLIYETDTGKMEQIGVVSWGIGCARSGMPGVYTKVTHFLDWIKEHTKDANYCDIPE